MARLSPEEGFKLLSDRVVKTVDGLFPIIGKKHTLKMDSVEVKDDLHYDDIRSQKKAKLEDRTWGVPVEGNIRLIDNKSGKTISKEKLRLLDLPKHTKRYSHIVGGQEYQVDNQWRLKPGVYSRVRDNGQLSSKFNLSKGRGFDVDFDPQKRQFTMHYGTSNIPLQPLLEEMGVSQGEMEKKWGTQIAQSNQKDSEKALMKFYKASTGEKASDIDMARTHLQETFGATELGAEVTKITLGRPHNKVTGSALMDGATKLLDISRGKTKPDQRDALMFKNLHSTEDFVGERIQKSSYKILRKIRNNIDSKNKVRDIVGPDVFNKPVKQLYQMGNVPDQTNPLEMMSGQMKTTITGEGGITSAHSIKEDPKLVDPSHLGFLDPIHTPEGACFSNDSEVLTKTGWKFWPDITHEDELACKIEGRLEFHKPQALTADPYRGKMYGVDTKSIERRLKYLVTPNHRIYSRTHDVRTGVRWRFEPAEFVHERTRVLSTTHQPYLGKNIEWFDIPYVEGNNSSKNIESVLMLYWADLMGWFLSEGHVRYDEATSSYVVGISQSEIESLHSCKLIEACLARLPVTWSSARREDGKLTYTIATKQLVHYFKQFGKSYEKFIPEYFFECSVEVREALLDSLLRGDGRIDSHRATGVSYKQKVYCTTSPQLALDVERLAISLGHGTKTSCYPDEREERYRDVYEIRLHAHTERMITWRKGHFYTEDYDGKVYCATVPGGLLYVRRDGGLAHWSGNSTGVSLRLPIGVRKRGHDVAITMFNTKTGRNELVNPTKAMESNVVLPDQIRWEGGKPKAISRSVKMSGPGNEIVDGSMRKADYVMRDPIQMFSMASNMVPFIAADHPNRSTMAGRHMEQAISLKNRQAPLVQSVAGTKTFHEVMGEYAGHRAHVDGTVARVKKDGIVINGTDGKPHEVQIYDNFPLNADKTFIHSTPLVKAGDKVKKGQPVADTNFTKGGTYATGTNLRVGYMPYKGYNFEDGVAISESAAQQLSSEHLYRKTVSRDKNHIFNKKKYQAYVPDGMNGVQSDKLDDDGVAKPGEIIMPGDPLIAALREKLDRREEVEQARMHKSLIRPYKDASVKWEGDHPGVVTEVVKRGKKTVVHVKTLEPAEVGDKLCFTEDTEVLTNTGWRPVADIVPGDVCYTTSNGIELQEVTEVHRYPTAGELYDLKSQQVDLRVTSNHKLYVRCRDSELFELVEAREVIGKRVRHRKNGVWVGVTPETFQLPELESKQSGKGLHKQKEAASRFPPIPIRPWATFLGAYLANGYCEITERKDRPGAIEYRTHICTMRGQHHSVSGDQYNWIRGILDECGFHYIEQDKGFIISSKQLTLYVAQFGHAADKHVPRECFGWGAAAAKWLLDGLLGCDGSKSSGLSYCTVSKQLSDDVQQLALHIGCAANIKETIPSNLKWSKRFDVRIIRTKCEPQINHGHTNHQSAQSEKLYKSDEAVFGITVPNGTLYVRVNGKAVWTGNSGSHGNKGIITRLIPDHEMPRAGGRHLQVLLNPTSVAGRTNLGQILETAAGKIAEKTGKTYRIKNFQPNVDLHKQVTDDLKRHGLTDKEEVTDPTTGRVLGNVLVGPQHIHKLQHQVDKKLRARAGGAGYAYDRNMIPKSGGPHGAQALGTLGLYSMLAHGAKCFLAGTTIRTDEGERVEISDVVRNRRAIDVHSWNSDEGLVEVKPIVAWSCRVAHPDELVCVSVIAKNPSGRKHLYKIKGTSGHEFYTPTGKVEAGDLKEGDKLFTPGVKLHPMQRQMILGSVLGDGSLSNSKIYSSSFRVNHGAPQEDYCRWKHKICAGIVRAGVQKVVKGKGSYSDGPKFRFWTLSVGDLSDLRQQFYPDGKKIIPQSVLDELTEVGLAFWFMDDGNTDIQTNRPQKYRTVRMAVCDFTEDDCERAKNWFFKRWGLKCTIQWKKEGEKRYPYLHFFNGHAADFLKIVAPYIHPKLEYKLHLDVAGHGFSKGEIESVGSRLHLVEQNAVEGLEEVTVLDVSPHTPRYYEDYLVYNIEVEGNHNYFANSVLVGNSNLREMQTVKSDAAQGDDFWAALQSGETLPAPRPTFAYKKFNSYLNALGVNVKKEGNNLSLVPFTDQQVKDMSNGRIKDAGKMVRAKDLKPEKGGLFDPTITGGTEGTKWSHLKLAEPMPNPLFEKPVKSLLGLTGSQYTDLVTGKKSLDKHGEIVTDLDVGITGGKAIGQLLGKIDTKAELELAHKQLSNPKLKGNRLDRVNKKVKYLTALQKAGLSPKESYMMQNVPVLPPSMRPLSQLPDGTLNFDDLNGHYKGLDLTSQKLRDISPLLPEEEKQELREELYDGLKGLTGLGGNANRKFRGVLDILGGKRSDPKSGVKTGAPKLGFFQNKLVQRKQDMSMRSTIIPEPALGLDEVGIPKSAALEIYKPFVVREIRGLTGVSPLQAQKQVKEGGPLVTRALERVMDKRPVLLKRDPVLHKYGIQAFKPRLVGGKAVQIHPLVTSGFNADFDGDQQINIVVACVSQEVYNADLTFWSARRLSVGARFEEEVGYVRSDGHFVVCCLEDFPHDKLMKSKGHIDFWSVPKGIKVVAVDDALNKLVLANVSYWSLHRAREVEIVTLGSGRQIITDDDARAVYGLDASSLEWCRRRPSESINQFVPVSSTMPKCEKSITHIPLCKEDRMHAQVLLDESFGYFLGLMVGDGWASYVNDWPKAINIANECLAVVEAWKRSLLSMFRELPTIGSYFTEEAKLTGSTGCMRYTISCAKAAGCVGEWIGRGAENKHLPPFFFAGPSSFRLGLLSGLWDSDGSVSWSFAKGVPQFMCSYQSASIRLIQEIQQLLLTFNVSSTITPSKTPKGKPFWALGVSIVDLHKMGGFSLYHEDKKAYLKEFLNASPPDDSMAYSRYRLVPIPSALAKELRGIVGNEDHSLYVTLSKAIKRQYMSKKTAKKLLELVPSTRCGHPLYPKWQAIVSLEGVHFERVKNVEVTGIKEDGFDLTVPGYETFMSLDGTILSNTMGAFVPVGNEAVEEAYKMLPSRNLFSPSTGSLMYTPTLEMQLGLYGITQEGKKTSKSFENIKEMGRARSKGEVDFGDQVRVGGVSSTVGKFQVAGALPGDMRKAFLAGKKPLQAKDQAELLTRVAKKHKNDYGDVVNRLKDLGNDWSTETAFSFGLDDIKPEKAIRKLVMDKADLAAANIRKGSGSRQDKDSAAIEIYDKATQDMHKKMDALPESRSKLFMMHNAGIKPGRDTLRQIKIAPMLITNAKGETIPTPVRRSYAEGLDIADFWTSVSGARKGIIQKVQSVQEPGYITKQVMNSTMNNTIIDDDCGTDKGIALPTDEKDILDRYLAADQKVGRRVFKAGTLVTPEVRTSLRNNKVGRVVVRSPLRCQHGPGLCKKCMGLTENGLEPEKGLNVGILAGQSLGERSVQLSMRSFHTGGTAASKSEVVDEFRRVKELLQFPETLPGSATLSTATGRVTAVQKDPAGGYNVTVGDKEHYVPEKRGVPMYGGKTLRSGMAVKRGAAISRGPVNPHEMLPLTGVEPVQGYLANELHKIYGPQGIRRRNTEVVVKALTNLTKVEDPGDHTEFIRGDFAPTSRVANLNRAARRGAKPIIHRPVLKGVNILPLDMQEDWIARMNHERIMQTIPEAAAKGWMSSLHGKHPIPPVVYGAEFGKGKPGEY